eukprot:CAMPEP_0198546204 /NCGR_PEP_ID=MMETSP1462-20131121/66653_1 /TAXON_ID=1333877 /ORGANISM="Brandtodinium nutriculum, Strain RCC3387" /LENGTH=32 /DNA_ID= /DNA_START= /DNA_END= /DNA_ORIENTATION=
MAVAAVCGDALEQRGDRLSHGRAVDVVEDLPD